MFQVKGKRLYHLIPLFFTLLLMGIVVWAFFLKEEPVPLFGGAIAILGIVGVIGLIVIFFALKMIFFNPPIITIDESGFEYNPGGVSTGKIPWSNVARIEEMEVMTGDGRSGPTLEWVLAIQLKDSTAYRQSYSRPIQFLMAKAEKKYDMDIFFRLSSFGRQVEEVKKQMMMHWKESKVRRD
jgi:hypothetical protein